jgi:arginine decarboxylase
VDIQVVSAHGEGQTLLSAFDTALFNAGVQDFNLIYLSSIIPRHSEIVEVQKVETRDSAYGDRLYVVHADARSDEVGQFIGAGIGWFQYGDDRRGLFVEHSVSEKTENLARQKIKSLLSASLSDLCAIRGVDFKVGEFGYKFTIKEVGLLPACALVLAIFKSEGWVT